MSTGQRALVRPVRRPRRRVALAVLVVALLATFACSSPAVDDARPGTSSGSIPAPEPARGGSLTVAVGGDAEGFSPLASQWSGSATQMARTVLDPLVVMDRDNRWQPYLAKSITPNADFTVWTFGLRPGVRFHNGEVLDAAALATFFEAVVSSPLSSQGFPERPVVTTLDDLTVSLTFSEPWSQMPTILADQPGYVIAPAQIASGDQQRPIGTGPFVFDTWVKGESFTATRNPDYWQAGLPYLDRISFRPIADPTARQSALDAGDADVIELGTPSRERLDDLGAQGYQLIEDVDRVGVMNLLMNTGQGVVSDHRIREAIVRGIDREAFRDAVLDPSYEVADQPYPAGSPWHADVAFPGYDPDRARQLVQEYTAEHGPASITIMTVAGGPTTAPEYFQQQLAAIGIQVTLDPADLARFIQQFVTGRFDVVFLGQFLSAADPDGVYPFLIGKNAEPETLIKLNFAGYRNDVVDEALKAQRRTDDVATRQRELATVWDQLATDLPYAFLAYDRYALVTQPDVHGIDAMTAPDGQPLPAINHWTPFYTAAAFVTEA